MPTTGVRPEAARKSKMSTCRPSGPERRKTRHPRSVGNDPSTYPAQAHRRSRRGKSRKSTFCPPRRARHRSDYSASPHRSLRPENGSCRAWSAQHRRNAAFRSASRSAFLGETHLANAGRGWRPGRRRSPSSRSITLRPARSKTKGWPGETQTAAARAIDPRLFAPEDRCAGLAKHPAEAPAPAWQFRRSAPRWAGGDFPSVRQRRFFP